VTEELFRVVIPARFESTRLPGKVLLNIAGKPMIQHVWERARESGACDIVIATDSDEVANIAHSFGADICMTSESCNSGSDRVAEVCRLHDWQDDMPVVNVQGDAPLIPPASIRRAAELLMEDLGAGVSTLCVSIKSEEEYLDPNVVKVVFDSQGRAIYFSRAPIPASGHGSDSAWEIAWRHLGLYAYRPFALQRLSSAAPCELEEVERLEQLRAIWLGMEIKIAVDEEAHGPDVDTAEDLLKVEALIAAQEEAKASEVPQETEGGKKGGKRSGGSSEPGKDENPEASELPADENSTTESETTDVSAEEVATGSEIQEPVSILFVCMGNICRSPTAEGVMRALVETAGEGLSVTIDSAGTHAYHEGEQPDRRAAQVALLRGIDLSTQRARAVQPADFDTFDLILAMDEDNLASLQKMQPENSRAEVGLFMNYSRKSPGASVPDPYYGGSLGFERVLDMLDESAQGLLAELRRRN